MASIHRDPRGKSPYWYCAYTLPNGRRVFRSTKQRDRKKAFDICRALEKASEKARSGELSEIQVRKMLDEILESVGQEAVQVQSVRSFFEDWLSGKKPNVSHSTFTRYQKVVGKFLQGLGERAEKSIVSVGPRDISAYRDRRRADGIAVGSLLQELKPLKAIFARARRQLLILHNPADLIEKPANKSTSRKIFTHEEVRALLEVSPEEWKTLILCGYYLGGRLMDMVRLSWGAVDLECGTIVYRQSKTVRTGKAGRMVEVPIHPDLEARLLALAGDNPHGYLCPTLSQVSSDGRSGLSNQFSRLMAKATIDPQRVKVGKRFFSRKSFHSLRSSFTSALANAGVPPEVRMKLTGHTGAGVHQRYTHLELQPLKQAIAKLPSMSWGANTER
jgi:integrase